MISNSLERANNEIWKVVQCIILEISLLMKNMYG